MKNLLTIYQDFKTWLILGYIDGENLLSPELKNIWFVDFRNFNNKSIYLTIKWENKYVGFMNSKWDFINLDAKLLLSFSEKLGCYYDLEWNWEKLLNTTLK